MRRTYTKEELVKAGVFEEALKMKGMDIDDLYLEDSIPDEMRLSDKEARRLGLLEPAKG